MVSVQLAAGLAPKKSPARRDWSRLRPRARSVNWVPSAVMPSSRQDDGPQTCVLWV